MSYLIWEMLLCLLLALAIGFLLGWLFRGHRSSSQRREAEERWLRRFDDQARALADHASSLAELRALVESQRCSYRPEDNAADPGEGISANAAEGGQALGLMHAAESASEAPAAVEEPPQPDDLKRVEGIGPKIEGLLNSDGIHTWAQLAAASSERLQRILQDAGPRYRMHDPTSWPDQARLAAEGRWQELEELQDILQGGRSG